MSRDEKANDGLRDAVKQRRERRALWSREGERTLGQNLAMIGALGWTIVTPTLLGILAGRWLDRRMQSGVFWTLSLILIGLTIGCALAWQRIQKA